MLEKLPEKFIVPASDILKMHPVVPQVMFPDIVQVPVVMMRLLVRVPGEIVVADIVRVVPIERVPAPTLIEHEASSTPGLGMETLPATVREFVPSILIMVLADDEKNVKEAQEAATSTVTMIPLLMLTASPDPGTELPPQVAGSLQ